VPTTRNPAIRNLLVSSGSLAVETTPVSPATSRPITVDDIVVKSAICLSTIAATAFLTAYLGLALVAGPAFLAGLGIGLFLIFRPRPSAVLTLTYCVAQGIVLGALTLGLNSLHPGIGAQAVTGTGAVFAAMLAVYRTRVIRLSRKLARWFVGLSIGLLLLLLVDLVAAAVHVDLGLRGGGVLGLVVTLVCIAAASFSFLLNFEAADQLIRTGAEVRWSWYIAFGLSMTLVWLYWEMLRLLSFFR